MVLVMGNGNMTISFATRICLKQFKPVQDDCESYTLEPAETPVHDPRILVGEVLRFHLAEAPRRRETAESNDEGLVSSDRRWEGLKLT